MFVFFAMPGKENHRRRDRRSFLRQAVGFFRAAGTVSGKVRSKDQDVRPDRKRTLPNGGMLWKIMCVLIL